MTTAANAQLKIAFVFRAPLGGLFRHVLDLCRGLIEHGHAVGIICDDTASSAYTEGLLAEIAPLLTLGLERFPIARNPGPADMSGIARVRATLARWQPDIVHGHGSKGGLYARLAPSRTTRGRVARAYTPHGGSLNYKPGSLLHRLYMMVEGVLERRTELFLFESDYVRRRYLEFVRAPRGTVRVVRNGIYPREFEPIVHAPDARDLVYVGEFRAAKGLDILVKALDLVATRIGRPPSIVFVGSGPDRPLLENWITERGLKDKATILTPRPVREALAMGHAIVVPSLAESLPYVSLEAAGAAQPMISTNVGGIPEIFGPFADRLIEPRDPEVLAKSITAMIEAGPESRRAEAERIAEFVKANFKIEDMVEAIVAAYRDALAAARGA